VQAAAARGQARDAHQAALGEVRRMEAAETSQEGEGALAAGLGRLARTMMPAGSRRVARGEPS
jgi:hypothetical protein